MGSGGHCREIPRQSAKAWMVGWLTAITTNAAGVASGTRRGGQDVFVPTTNAEDLQARRKEAETIGAVRHALGDTIIESPPLATWMVSASFRTARKRSAVLSVSSLGVASSRPKSLASRIAAAFAASCSTFRAAIATTSSRPYASRSSCLFSDFIRLASVARCIGPARLNGSLVLRRPLGSHRLHQLLGVRLALLLPLFGSLPCRKRCDMVNGLLWLLLS
jgi:hypothetical protein